MTAFLVFARNPMVYAMPKFIFKLRIIFLQVIYFALTKSLELLKIDGRD